MGKEHHDYTLSCSKLTLKWFCTTFEAILYILLLQCPFTDPAVIWSCFYVILYQFYAIVLILC